MTQRVYLLSRRKEGICYELIEVRIKRSHTIEGMQDTIVTRQIGLSQIYAIKLIGGVTLEIIGFLIQHEDSLVDTSLCLMTIAGNMVLDELTHQCIVSKTLE